MNNLWRSVISSINGHITKVLKYVDNDLQSLAEKIKSYTRDTMHFLNKINDIKTSPNDTILMTLYIKTVLEEYSTRE